MKLMIDPADLAALGVHEEVSIILPDGFETYTRAERWRWAEQEIANILEDLNTLVVIEGGVQ